MGHSPPAPGFGHVDLELDLDLVDDEAVRPPAAAAFGQVDFDIPPGEEQVPPSTSRVFGAPKAGASTKATRRNMAAVDDESTRIVHGDALSNITRPPPPLEPVTQAPQSPARKNDDSTRAWADVDAELLAAARVSNDEAPPSSRNEGAPSGSGVATRDGRVAAMRELYAKGDAAGALALAETLNHTSPPSGPSHDHPDASIAIEMGEEEITDPFGGLIPLGASPTTAPPPPSRSAPPLLSLTARHSIPRILKSAVEVAKLPIDHRAGFLLAAIDGKQTLEEILDVCAMPAAEALDLISKLKGMDVIDFE